MHKNEILDALMELERTIGKAERVGETACIELLDESYEEHWQKAHQLYLYGYLVEVALDYVQEAQKQLQKIYERVEQYE